MERITAIKRAVYGIIMSLVLLYIFPSCVMAGDTVKLHFLCVNGDNSGQDAILIESNGEFGFVDCGQWKDRERIRSAMRDIGVTHENLKFVIGTHAHADHIGFLNDMMKEYRCIERIYLMPFTANCLTDPSSWKDTSWENAMKTADKLKIPVVNTFAEGASTTPWAKPNKRNRYTASPHFMFGDASIDIYNYSQKYIKEKVVNANDASLVVKITANGHTALITGDLSNAPGIGSDIGKDEEAMAKMIGHVDILKAPHHGYRWEDTNSPDDLLAFSPQWLIQTGYTSFFDYQYSNSRSFDTVLDMCRSGMRYAATGWYDRRVVHNDDGRSAITIRMDDLSSNLDEDVIIIAADQSGNTFGFKGGRLYDGPASKYRAYLSVGTAYNEEIQCIDIGEASYIIDSNGEVMSGKTNIGEKVYECDADTGRVTKVSAVKPMPDFDPTIQIVETIQATEDDQWKSVYFGRFDRNEMLDELNKIRRENGKSELVLSRDQTPADVRAINVTKGMQDENEHEMVVIEFGKMDIADLIQKIRSDEQMTNLVLGNYTEVAESYMISPRDIGCATLYVIEFYGPQRDGVTEPETTENADPDISQPAAPEEDPTETYEPDDSTETQDEQDAQETSDETAEQDPEKSEDRQLESTESDETGSNEERQYEWQEPAEHVADARPSTEPENDTASMSDRNLLENNNALLESNNALLQEIADLLKQILDVISVHGL